MKKRILPCLAALAAFTLCAQDVSIGKNLTGWVKSKAPNISFDQTVKVSENGSVRMHDGAQISRKIALKPATKYVLSYSVKGENIASENNSGARIMITNGKRWGRFTTSVTGQPESGTFDWREGKANIDSSVWGTEITVFFSVSGKGTVWYDKVSLKEEAK